MTPIQCTIRWKEELVCVMDGHTFIIEITMGVLTVYLPTSDKWDAVAPEWAHGQWERVHRDIARWCDGQNIPLVIDAQTWVSFH